MTHKTVQTVNRGHPKKTCMCMSIYGKGAITQISFELSLSNFLLKRRLLFTGDYQLSKPLNAKYKI